MKQFQGPLDLLLQLTKEKKLDITEVSLAKITDQYLEHLKNLDKMPLDDLANFLAVASRLVLIKSKMLLPTLELTEEDEEDIEALKQQIENYKRFQELALNLKQLNKLDQASYSRESFQGLKSFFCPPKGIKAEDLASAFKKVLREINAFTKDLPEKSIKLKVSLSERIKIIQEEVFKKIQTNFQQIIKNNKDKPDIIVSFLALLELMKQKIIIVEQEKAYGEIKINKRS